MSDVLRNISSTSTNYYRTYINIGLAGTVDPYLGEYRIISWFNHYFNPENVAMRWRGFIFANYGEGSSLPITARVIFASKKMGLETAPFSHQGK